MARRLRYLGIAAFIAYRFLPLVALYVLIGLAVSWWLTAALVGGFVVVLIVVRVAARSHGLLGRAVGTTGYDPLDYTQWPRHLVVRPIVESLPASFAVIAAIVVTTLAGASGAVSWVVIILSGIAGFIIGIWIWARAEVRREAARGSSARDERAR